MINRRIGARGPCRVLIPILVLAVALGCETGGATAEAPPAQDGAPVGARAATGAIDTIPAEAFAALIERISEEGGYFDTDNLISNEAGYLNVMDVLARAGRTGGAYVGVGPDQNYSYIAEVRPDIAFLTDVRRDNLLHHLLLKALIEDAPKRTGFLSALFGLPVPDDADPSEDADVEALVAGVYRAWADPSRDVDAGFDAAHARVRGRIEGYGLPLDEDDFATIRRFHAAFAEAGPGLRFTSYGRPPRPYYPTYRQLLLETDIDGDRVSYLASGERYHVVREMHLANRIVPVVGDLAGPSALRTMGEVMREMGVELTAFYVSNVEFYLWQYRTFDAWVENAAALPAAPDALLIRSYFGNFRRHPESVAGYYATQLLQPWSSLVAGDFTGYWDLVTRDVVPLR